LPVVWAPSRAIVPTRFSGCCLGCGNRMPGQEVAAVGGRRRCCGASGCRRSCKDCGCVRGCWVGGWTHELPVDNFGRGCVSGAGFRRCCWVCRSDTGRNWRVGRGWGFQSSFITYSVHWESVP
jgi:hypothetical protein